MSATKKQHYVWREYLRKFCYNGDRIFSLINRTKLVSNNIVNVAHENFFHKAQDFDQHEITFLQRFLNDYLEHMDEIRMYFQTILDHLKLTLLKKDENFNHIDFEKLVQNDFFESRLTDNENLGKFLINIRNIEELNECFNEKNIFKTHLYLSIQLIRTKRQKQIFFKNFDIQNINPEKVWLFLALTIGHVLAFNLTFKSKYQITLIKNQTIVEFITSDQPVFNLKEEDRDENGTTKSFSLYYPISPTRALLLDYDGDENSIKDIECNDENYVNQFNEIMAKNADMFIFSNSKEILEKYQNSI